ncbi:MurR/RpiR family transcriptional regulator [Bacillus sp. T33-2]|uniref:MurR/RpiR family transcriptional regulator n=1 Tax=Bacillus sp. T33-2 TaxID=2054168 RepID=UPI000C75611B|nr:MurR/RpiR family transcriptional regulator [Bacillus sp. T33-2]PLR95764.1 MurR/RpiR family transcriptional regulator [Bacillus sp. T33-2]
MESIKRKIEDQFDQFSKGLKKVATYFLKSPEAFAVQPAEQIGKEIGVSETTVIRFCHALGYNGYSLFQKDIQDNMFNRQSSLFEYQAGKKQMEHEPHFAKKMLLMDADIIRQTAEGLSEGNFKEAVSRLSGADQVLVSGVRSSHSMAHWFSFSLDLVRGNVRMFRPDTDDVLLRIGELNEDSTLVAFSFHRYALETINIAKEAKKRGAYVIAITDSKVAPIRAHSDISFTVQLPVKSTLDAAPAIFSLMNAIVAGISVKNPELFEKRRKAYENLRLENFFGE